MQNYNKISIFIIVVFTAVLHHQSRAQPNDKNIATGKYVKVHSKILNEDRTILVNLPDDYETSSKIYPILYILDGEDIHRLIRSLAAITFYSGVRRFPKMIIIAILNTDRIRDMTPRKILQRENSGHGDAFWEFIVSELNPYIERKYRSARYRILFGGSLAGMFTVYTLFDRPESFDVYIASRPTLNSLANYTWDSDVIFKKAENLFAGKLSLQKSLYIDYGGQEDALHDPTPIHKLSAIIKLKAPQDFHCKIRAMSESGYRSAESLKDGLLALFDDWYYSADSLFIHGFKGIENYAKKLSEEYAYAITVADLLAEQDLLIFGYRFLEHNNITEAIALFEYAVTAYPNSWNVYDSLAEGYMIDGQKELSIQYYQKSLEINPNNENAKQKLKELE